MSAGQIDAIPDEEAGEAGRLIGGKYRLHERLGEGALGVVHRAVHVGLERPFAIKLLKTAGAPAFAILARFRREALALGRLQHPHIVEVTDSGIDEPGGVPYLVMELLEGVPLSDVCRQGPLPLAQALPILGDIAEAIDAAHGAGILHCDLKPGNVFVGTDGVKVLDFGLAELLASSDGIRGSGGMPSAVDGSTAGTIAAGATGRILGTPLYVAPELVWNGNASRVSDVYSFGVLAYEMLGGKPPFQGTVAEVLKGHLELEPPPLPLPREVWLALREALRKEPALRPRTAGEVVRRLRDAAAQAGLRRWRSSEIPRRIRMAAFLAALLGAAGLVLPWPALPGTERRIGDLRVRTSPARAPDPRILLVTFDEASLRRSPLSLGERADEIGGTLSQILDAGARGVAVDFQLPATWSASPAFSELLLRHPGKLTLAAFSSPDGSVLGTECMDRLTAVALGPQASRMFGFVNLDEDRDGVVRRGRLWFRDRSGNERPSWAAHASRADPGEVQGFLIDARIDWPRYSRISWWKVPAALDRNPGLFRDQLVLVGGGFRGFGDDYNRIPYRSGTGEAVSNLTLQALMVDTIGAGLPVREPGRAPVLVVAVLVAAFAMAGLLCATRAGPISAWFIAALCVYLAVSFPVFWWMGLMLPVTTPLLVVLFGLLFAFALRRILSSPPEISAS